MLKYISVISILFLIDVNGMAQLKPAHVFADNMVIQRDKPVCVYGKGIPKKKVEVLFNHKIKTTLVKADSSWKVYFSQQPANSHPQSLFITCERDSIIFNNILIGDVWICLGLSNVEFVMCRGMHF